ncbi:MAG TPA: YceH family protein [Chitinivibrionales bacterium]|nr:YceH family protein [Chitinivibrionales bacterium]
MDITLSPVEARVLGSLVEKELTTPEYYPLSLNALVLACNQKNNRDPVMSLSEEEVSATLTTLRSKDLAWQMSTAGGRVPKYEHSLPARLSAIKGETGATHQDSIVNGRTVATNQMRPELAVLTALMLRGPLTGGELRGVTGRMYSFKDPAELETTIQKLMNWENGPLIVKLPKQPGRKEQRYAHLFSGDAAAQPGPSEAVAAVPQAAAPATGLPLNDRLSVVEQKVAMLLEEVVTLKQAIIALKKPQ